MVDISIPFSYDPIWDNTVENFYNLLRINSIFRNDINLQILPNFITISCEDEVFGDIIKNELLDNYKEYLYVPFYNKNKDRELMYLKDYCTFDKVGDAEKDSFDKRYVNTTLYKNPEKELEEIITANNELSDKKEYYCSFCGKKFSKSYKGVQQGMYLLSTLSKSFNGSRNFDNGHIKLNQYNQNICPICALIGLLQFFDKKIIYSSSISENASFLYYPVFDNFVDLHKFKQNLKLEHRRFCNLPQMNGYRISSEYNTLLYMYELFIKSYPIEYSDLNWYVLTVPHGSIKNTKLDYGAFKSSMFNIVKELLTKENIDVYDVFNVTFKTGVKDSDEFKDKLIKYFLDDDFNSFSRLFELNSEGYVSYSKKSYGETYNNDFNLLIKKWRCKVMTENEVNCIEKAGRSIGQLAVNNETLFHRLYSIYSIDDFHRYARTVSKALVNSEDMYPSENNILAVFDMVKKDNTKLDEVVSELILYSGCTIRSIKMKKPREEEKKNIIKNGD